MRLHLRTQRAIFVTWPATLALLLMPLAACAKPTDDLTQTHYQTIKNFVDLGSNPTALIEGSDRNLYGTMRDGGRKWEGVVFKLNKDGSGYTVLHDFTSERDGADGTWPQGVVEGRDGTLYGTTQLGGTGRGTVFKVNKDGSG